MKRTQGRTYASKYRTLSLLLLGPWLVCVMLSTALHAAEHRVAAVCQPTPRDALGPFYKPGAPLRSSVGEGYVLQGVVRSAATCEPLPAAIIEFWMAGPDGQYRDAYRARVQAGEAGQYALQSHAAVGYAGRPPHIHIRVTAAGHRVLVTQHYPKAGQPTATFDLVLRPE